MEDNETQIAIRNTAHQKSQMGNATINNSLSHLDRRRSRRKSREFLKIHRENVKRRSTGTDTATGSGTGSGYGSTTSTSSCVSGGAVDAGEGDEESEKEEVERKIKALQRIVPGGESLGVDKLFDETAGYILALQCQLKAMRTLAAFVEGLEKRKFGG
ncbi:transcription factor PAR1-like [Humulus lupulus]|uniref:transcription factor PAR1-like n=1 Tax=Humulus lupulus TaxID=3486 RepID=UPI002B405900|nr:transcription factor PAR1-like [Humulus lupulus]